MIELKKDALIFSFPEVHGAASFRVDFQRTLRIPDDGRHHFLPPGLGRFPLRLVDDFAARTPPAWLAHGGIVLPMYQSEALWLNFTPFEDVKTLEGIQAPYADGHWVDGGPAFGYPFALKVATGKVNAVTGEAWANGLHDDPQDYVVIPQQPWLDGYCVERDVVRQFVAMPLGSGYSAEEQITGAAEHGGIQLIAYPMKREAYERRRAKWEKKRAERREPVRDAHLGAAYCLSEGTHVMVASADMGLAPGGRMRQQIYDDPYRFEEWDTEAASRCFVHLTNSLVWRAITGQAPPTTPPTAKEYTAAGLPWFDYYADAKTLPGAGVLAGLKSVLERGREKGDVPLPENDPVDPVDIVRLRVGLRPEQVREGRF